MYFSQLIKCFLLFAILVSCLIEVRCLTFTYPKFQPENETDLIRHNSYIVLNAIQVTPDVSGGSITNLSGRAFYKEPFKLWGKRKHGGRIRSSFNSTFVLNISPRSFPGGEGVAFVLAADSNLPENSQGQWLGIVNANTNGNPQAEIVAVEFDTRKSYPGDVDGNHVGLDVNSIYSIKQVPLGSFGINLSAGVDVKVRIQYEGEELAVFVGEDARSPVFSEPIDLSAYLPKEVFVGFSASTSNYTELNCVRSWEFYSSHVNEDHSLLWVKIVVPIVAALLIGIGFFSCWKWKKSRNYQPNDAYPNIEEEIKGSSMAPVKFTFKELRQATGKFNLQNMLGKGGFGTVYKGILKNKEVAVKRISRESSQGKQEFIAEVTTIGNFHHKNLVKLIGWCYERSEFLLVYEYMPNGSLDKLIFSDENTELQENELNWGRRLTVISGVAQALDYLHNGCEKRVLHRDIKASNIMLDAEFNAKLGDFGLARIVKQREQTHHSTKDLAGTLGYMAPECFFTRRATAETDVYAFGVLVLEVACGRKTGNQNEKSDYNSRIVSWVWELHRIGRLLDAVDQKLNGEFSEEEMECVLILGLACCNPNPEQRPSMKIVLQVLTGEVHVPEVPAEMPAFVWPTMAAHVKQSDGSLIGSQLTPFSEVSGR